MSSPFSRCLFCPSFLHVHLLYRLSLIAPHRPFPPSTLHSNERNLAMRYLLVVERRLLLDGRLPWAVFPVIEDRCLWWVGRVGWLAGRDGTEEEEEGGMEQDLIGLGASNMEGGSKTQGCIQLHFPGISEGGIGRRCNKRARRSLFARLEALLRLASKHVIVLGCSVDALA